MTPLTPPALPLPARLAAVTSPDGVGLGFAYDGFLERTVSFTGPVQGSIARVFDSDFRLVGHRLNGQALANYAFDADGLLVQAGRLVLRRDGQTGFLTGSEVGVVNEDRQYNAYGELTEQVYRVAGTVLLTLRSQRDALGRVVAKEEEQGGQLTRWEYGYDQAGRLVSERKVLPDGSVLETQWSYDANGNRVQEVKPSGEVISGSYDEQDRLLSYGDLTFTYTHHGELFSQCQGSACRQYTYDVFGNLRQVVLDNGQVIEYLVDGRNRRMGKKINGVLVQGWLWDDQLRILAELDGQNNVVAKFIYAEGINVPELMEKGGRTYRLIKDQLGSVRFVVDTSDGSIWQEMRYDAWGNVVYDSNSGFQPFGFAAGLYDPHTRLVRFGARDYDPSLARWLKRDSIAVADLNACGATNLFLYACGAPIEYTDPRGLAVDYQCPATLKTEILGWFADGCEYLKSQSCQNVLRRFQMDACMAERCRGNCYGDDLVLTCARHDSYGERNWCAGTSFDRCTITIDYAKTRRGLCGSPATVIFHELIHSCGPINHGHAFAIIHQKCLGMDPWQRDGPGS